MTTRVTLDVLGAPEGIQDPPTVDVDCVPRVGERLHWNGTAYLVREVEWRRSDRINVFGGGPPWSDLSATLVLAVL